MIIPFPSFLGEVQKISHWSEVIKRLWDEDSFNSLQLKVLVLGSSALLIQRDLTESLAGRFEIMHLPHWSLNEMEECFNMDLDQYIYFGGYPGAAPLVNDEDRWRNYIIDSLIETSISRDILMMKRVDKPALLRRLFHLGCEYSGQILSYQKMLGQLHDAGNTTTLSHYLMLLSKAGMLTGIPKFSTRTVKQKASSPKLQVLNTGLMSALSPEIFSQARLDRERWGRWVESAVGAHLVNASMTSRINVFYWRDRNKEVDFVMQKGDALIALEVKSGIRKTALPGLAIFDSKHSPKKGLLIGGSGIPVREFLRTAPELWFD